MEPSDPEGPCQTSIFASYELGWAPLPWVACGQLSEGTVNPTRAGSSDSAPSWPSAGSVEVRGSPTWSGAPGAS